MEVSFKPITRTLRCAVRRMLPLGQRFVRDDQGSAVEFGLVAVPFLGLLMAIFEVGLHLLAQQSLETGTREAARLIRTGRTATGFTQDNFKTALCNSAGIMLPSCTTKIMLDVKRYSSFAAANFNLPRTLRSGALSVSYANSCAGDVVVVRAYYDWPNYTNLLGSSLATRPNNMILLTGLAVFRNEPFSSTCASPL